LFSASVRAPLTGIVLTVEMTGRGDLTLSLLGASLVAMVVAMLLKSEPIYETLKRRMLAHEAVAEKTITRAITAFVRLGDPCCAFVVLAIFCCRTRKVASIRRRSAGLQI